MNGLKVLIACEESQTVCKAFRERGFQAYSCDIEPCSGGHPEWHIEDDVTDYLDEGCLVIRSLKKHVYGLKNLPLLTPTDIVDKGNIITYESCRRMHEFYADTWHLPPKERARVRSKTFEGIAQAMADQWGNYIKGGIY